MTCRATHLNTATTSEARVRYGLSDGQIQSLFHELKRQGKELHSAAPDEREYVGAIEKREFRLRHDITLPESVRQRLLRSLLDTESDPLPDGPTWHAVTRLPSKASSAARRLHTLTRDVAADMGVNEKRLNDAFSYWRDADDSEFEQVTSPDPSYAYTPELLTLPADKGTTRALKKLGYEHYLSQRLPVFVYGTLRQGQGNSGLMDPAVESTTPAELRGVGIYGANQGFPYAVEHQDPLAITKGEIAYLEEGDEGDNARMRLDQLEGFDSNNPSTSHYERVKMFAQVDVERQTRDIAVWTYMARGYARDNLHESGRIPDGDWVAAKTNRYASRY